MDFSGRTAIVTGAAVGIGLLTCKKLAEYGANVVLTDVNEEAIQAGAEEIRAAGGEAIAVKVDVTDYAQIENAVTIAMEKYGHIDTLVYAAGGAPTRVFNRPEPFHERDVKLLDWGIDVNLKGALFFARAVMGHMIDNGEGVIINIGSIDGSTGSGAVEYSTAKSGMKGLTKSLALCGAPHKVRACCVAPGPVLTRAAMSNMWTPLGRAAETIEIVDFILYLCSDKAAFITGSYHLVDGGRNCGAR